jgi:iron(III) transport system substrate-binding protein
VRPARRAVSTAVIAVAIIVLLVITGGAAYYIGTSTSSGVTTTTTSTSASTTTNTVTSTSVVSTTIVTTLQNQASLAQAECAKQTNNVCLTIYSTMDTGSWTKDFAPLFYQTYPWAQGKIQFVALSAAQLSTKTISEYQAKAVQADVVEGTIGPYFPNILAGAIQNYSSPLIPQLNYSAGDYDKNGAWTVVFQAPSDIVYNPKVLAQLNLPVPATWSDLANPVYKGHIDFQTGTNLATTGSVFYWLYKQMGNATWTQLMKNIAANNPTIASSGGAVTTNAVTGQVPIGIGSYNDYLTAKATPNATVAVVTPSPTLENPAVEGIAANAPHPQMARLFVDWWISPTGQSATAASGRTPYNPVLAQNLGLVPPGIPAVNAWGNDITTVFPNANFWSTVYRNLFGG